MKSLPHIMVAPNGARLTKADHPNLPMTQDEILECAVECVEAGADGFHLHIRDESGQPLLEVDAYRSLLNAMRIAVPETALQITTESAGCFDVDLQMKVALESGADMVSASVREIHRAGKEQARAFYKECADVGCAVQHILYDVSDCDLLATTLGRGELTDTALQIIFVLGRYSDTGNSKPADLSPFLDWMTAQNLTPDWAVCAFGPGEISCLKSAYSKGGKCRVGFENSLYLSDGRIAERNSEKVSDLIASLGIATA